MFRIAKSVDVKDENITVEAQICNGFKIKNGKSVSHQSNDLNFNIMGVVDNDEYCLNFIITKQIEEYKNIKNGDKIVIKSSEIADSYINVNDKVYLDLAIDIEVYRINDDLSFNIVFREYDNNYFGSAWVEVNLNDIKLKKDCNYEIK